MEGYHEALLEKPSGQVAVEQLRKDPALPRVVVAYIKQLVKLVIIQTTPALGVNGHVEES